ncbi:hypothetical protein GW17_00011522 [Ensete ventricosum]|nr:hypothetical protein GW17_00011522 [Ensete ventricosum]
MGSKHSFFTFPFFHATATATAADAEPTEKEHLCNQWWRIDKLCRWGSSRASDRPVSGKSRSPAAIAAFRHHDAEGAPLFFLLVSPLPVSDALSIPRHHLRRRLPSGPAKPDLRTPSLSGTFEGAPRWGLTAWSWSGDAAPTPCNRTATPGRAPLTRWWPAGEGSIPVTKATRVVISDRETNGAKPKPQVVLPVLGVSS